MAEIAWERSRVLVSVAGTPSGGAETLAEDISTLKTVFGNPRDTYACAPECSINNLDSSACVTTDN